MQPKPTRHVVIGGGGFAGLYAAQSLRRAQVRVALIDRRNFHLFQPLLYQVATGGPSPADITSPLRAVLRRQRVHASWSVPATPGSMASSSRRLPENFSA
jgi:NADH dehydrogenase